MLNFTFTPAQEEFRERLREFALRELLPHYQTFDAERRYPREQIKRVIRFAADYWSGREDEWDLVAVGITAEEVARGDFNCVLPGLGEPYHSQFLDQLSAAQRERWLPGLTSGEQTVGLAITEPAAGSDMGRLQARAERRGERWLINGVKDSVSYLNADVFYVFVRTDPQASGWQGLSSFLIPRDTPGLSFEEIEDLGNRAIPRGVLRMQDVEVGDEDLVGELGTAFIRISQFFDVNRAVIGLKCVGAALQSLDETLDRVTTRIAFGGPLYGHQGVSFPLAEGATLLDLARWQCYRVLWMRQHGIPCQREGAMAKWYAPKVAAEVIQQCLLFHGHKGYSLELPIQQRLRDVIGWRIGDGSEEVMKLIIARDLVAERQSRATRAG
ncbi:MAG: acyl-CoA dehydrogenase family protein [Deltaproteobacteria bacterium]|nr:acyl-CoA dehydrogenase family protein [Deltaproteobacteria bacterium]